MQEAKSKIIDTLASLFHFYQLYAKIDSFDPKIHHTEEATIMDKWILSRLATTISSMKKEMENYQLTNAARLAGNFIDEMSNWYIRRNRERFWSKGMSPDKIAAFQTLYQVLNELSKLIAPFVPFIAEEIFTRLMGIVFI